MKSDKSFFFSRQVDTKTPWFDRGAPFQAVKAKGFPIPK